MGLEKAYTQTTSLKELYAEFNNKKQLAQRRGFDQYWRKEITFTLLRDTDVA